MPNPTEDAAPTQGYDSQGNLITPGQFVVDDSSQVPALNREDIDPNEGTLSGMPTAQAVSTINAMANTAANIAILQAVIKDSNNATLVSAAQSQLNVFQPPEAYGD